MRTIAEFIWIDGKVLKSKTKMLDTQLGKFDPRVDLPLWETEIDGTPCILKPCFYALDPLRKDGICVLCETFNEDGTPHSGNERAKLRAKMEIGSDILDVSVVQQFSLATKGEKISRHQVFKVTENHLKACNEAALFVNYYDSSKGAGHIEFEMEVGVPVEHGGTVSASDQIVMARYLLSRIADLNDILVKVGSTHKTILKIVSKAEAGEAHEIYDGAGAADPYSIFNEILKKD